MDYGSVIEWRVAPGDTVTRGDVVAVVATEKADIDVEIWQSGTVAELLLEIDREVPVGTPMLRLEAAAGAQAPAPEVEPVADVSVPEVEPVAQAPASVVERVVVAPAPVRTPTDDERIPASPLARARADECGVDLRAVVGSGPDGAVLLADVEAHLESAPAHGAAMTGESRAARRAEGMRHAIAERMAKANRDIPHYHLDVEVDLGPMHEALERHNAGLPVAQRVLPAAMFLEAAATAAAAHPECNGNWTEQGFAPSPSVDLAVAISLRRGGLVTPVIGAADTRSTTEIMALLKEFVTAARSGSLKSRWMVEGSLTVTNLGDNGADRVHGVIFPPQVALVGFGRTMTRPWVVDSIVVPRPIVAVSLAADHRATDGLVGSRFLATLAQRLEHPEIT